MADRVSTQSKRKTTQFRGNCVDHCILLLNHLSNHKHFMLEYCNSFGWKRRCCGYKDSTVTVSVTTKDVKVLRHNFMIVDWGKYCLQTFRFWSVHYVQWLGYSSCHWKLARPILLVLSKPIEWCKIYEFWGLSNSRSGCWMGPGSRDISIDI